MPEPKRYRLSGEVQAIQWRGDNVAEMEAFAGSCFDALTEPCDDDPDATASVFDGTNNTWKLLYAGDWVTRGSGGDFHAVRQAQFDTVYVEVVDPAGDDLAGQLADARHELDVLRGGITDFSERPELDQARGELVTAVREVADLRALFDLQWKRTGEAMARWRAEDPESRAQVRPDLGDLLQWLMADADRLRAERDRAVAHDRQPYPTADAYEAACAALEKHRERADRAEAERDQLRQHILDIDAHATPYGDIPDEPGWVGTYLVTAGALHRALGKIGHSAPNCEAEARLAAIEQHARDAGTRLLELQAERGELALALEQVTAERDRRGEELRRAQAVIEAAKVWAAAVCTLHQPQQLQAAVDRLAAAIDALDHGEAGRDG